MIFIALFSALVLLGTFPPIETVNLHIHHKDKIVGQFSAYKNTIGNITLYESKSTVKSSTIRVEVTYEIRVVFKKGILQESDLKMMINGKLKTHSQTKKENDHYTFSKNGKDIGNISGPITHSTIMLYFAEPVNIIKTYSEERGNFCKILPRGPGTYQKINAKGKVNTYSYEDNIVRHIFIKNTLIDFEMTSAIGQDCLE